MASVLNTTIPTDWSVADMVAHLGGVPLERIRLHPPPGTATEGDVVAIEAREDRLCELVDGVLVEKSVGNYESLLAAHIIRFLAAFVEDRDLGMVLAPDAMLRILPGQVRMPDVCFISWNRVPDRRLPKGAVWELVPDLAIEILSQGNTEGEMQRKLREYFAAGVRLVWYVDPSQRSVRVFTAVDQIVTVAGQQVLSGGDVLPGFELRPKDLFAKLPPREHEGSA